MEDEKKIEVKTAVPVLPCGHEFSFEHMLVEDILTLAEEVNNVGRPVVEPCMEYLREVFAYFYLQVPTFDEMQKIALSHKLNDDKTKEVN